MEWLQVFGGLAVIDVLYAVYTKQVQNDKPLWSAMMASTMFLVNAFVVISIVGNHWLIIPAVLGSFIGTYAGVRINMMGIIR